MENPAPSSPSLSTPQPCSSIHSSKQSGGKCSKSIVRARGFLWGTTADEVRTFFSDCEVEGVHFVDPLHGECYVEMATETDQEKALNKHALRLGNSYKKRLIEVFGATFEEMKYALIHDEERQDRSRKRKKKKNRNRRRCSYTKTFRSWSRSRSRSGSRGRRSRSSSRNIRYRSGSSSREERSRSRGKIDKRSNSRENSPSPGVKEQVDCGLGGERKLLSNCGESPTRDNSSGCSEYGEGDSVGKVDQDKAVVEGLTEFTVKKEVEEEVQGNPQQNNFLSMNITVKQEPGYLEEQLENVLRDVEKKNEEIIKLREEVAGGKTCVVKLQEEIDQMNHVKEANSLLENRAKMNEMIIADFKKEEKDFNKSLEEISRLNKKIDDDKEEIAGLQQTVNQLSVEKQLLTSKVMILEQANEGLRREHMARSKKDEVFFGLNKFLESGRKEIALIKEDVKKLRDKEQVNQKMLEEKNKTMEDLRKENDSIIKKMRESNYLVKTLKGANAKKDAEFHTTTNDLKRKLNLITAHRDRLKKLWLLDRNEKDSLKKELAASQYTDEHSRKEVKEWLSLGESKNVDGSGVKCGEAGERQ